MSDIISEAIRNQVLALDPNAVTLWRCTKCEKWSHAMKKPSSHKRGVVSNEGSPFGPQIEMVPCGPFHRWTAVKG